jgi:hypothetical protein
MSRGWLVAGVYVDDDRSAFHTQKPRGLGTTLRLIAPILCSQPVAVLLAAALGVRLSGDRARQLLGSGVRKS